MRKEKILFIDRDGTLIREPDDKQVDSIEKMFLMPGVITSLLRLQEQGYVFVMVTNQDGLGTASFPQDQFNVPHQLMLNIFLSQGIQFKAIKICPHLPADNCDCRKPKVGLILDYLTAQIIDKANSYVIGDRETDIQLANNMDIQGIRFGTEGAKTWQEVTDKILFKNRKATVSRHTNETAITVNVNLDSRNVINIQTGIGFFNHMLEQLAKHGGFSLSIEACGDLHIDDHHTVEDTAIALGEAMRKALGDKYGIERYGYLLPMDEALTQVALDLSGRAYCVFEGEFTRERVNDLATELVPHFFQSFAEALKANLHINVQGKNTHHMIESIYKGVGRVLAQAIAKKEGGLPSTKGVL